MPKRENGMVDDFLELTADDFATLDEDETRTMFVTFHKGGKVTNDSTKVVKDWGTLRDDLRYGSGLIPPSYAGNWDMAEIHIVPDEWGDDVVPKDDGSDGTTLWRIVIPKRYIPGD